MSRVVMGRADWPEANEKDFLVFQVDPQETDEEAIKRAEAVYGCDIIFYCQERGDVQEREFERSSERSHGQS